MILKDVARADAAVPSFSRQGSTADKTIHAEGRIKGQEQLLTVREVAKWLQVSSGWVHDHATGRRKPVLPCVKLGKLLRFRPSEVVAWLEELRNLSIRRAA